MGGTNQSRMDKYGITICCIHLSNNILLSPIILGIPRISMNKEYITINNKNFYSTHILFYLHFPGGTKIISLCRVFLGIILLLFIFRFANVEEYWFFRTFLLNILLVRCFFFLKPFSKFLTKYIYTGSLDSASPLVLPQFWQ